MSSQRFAFDKWISCRLVSWGADLVLVPVGPRCRVGTKDWSPVFLTEPDVRFTHPAPWIGVSELQRKLVRDLRRVDVVPQGRGGRLGRDSVSVPLSGSSAGW